MIAPVSPLEIDRFELKYLIPLSQVATISRYVEAYCEMDYYSQISPDSFYMINTLYLDSPSLYFFRSKLANDINYFSLRIRGYGQNPEPPFFLEIKSKNQDFCKKRRSKVMSKDLTSIFNPQSSEQSSQAFRLGASAAHFSNLVTTYSAQPTILTQYRRKAYLSKVDRYARVTFDLAMKYCERLTWDVAPGDSLMSPYDHPETYRWPDRNVILELKCERQIPYWIVDLIRIFNLERSNFSKFKSSMLDMNGVWERDVLRDLTPALPIRH
jgi:SPX domain protein involved in polyphosphate accumulation